MNKKCPWCNSENNHKFLELKDYFLTQEEFEILECDDCKLLFTNPCPTPDKIGDYYKSEDYLSHNEEKKSLFALEHFRSGVVTAGGGICIFSEKRAQRTRIQTP